MGLSERLPERFQDLDRFVADWALPPELERNARRRSSSMPELRDFYHAMLPRMDEIIVTLNAFSLDHIPEHEKNLLALSFMEVSPAVELFNEPDESGVFDAARYLIVEVAGRSYSSLKDGEIGFSSIKDVI